MTSPIANMITWMAIAFMLGKMAVVLAFLATARFGLCMDWYAGTVPACVAYALL